MLISCKRKEPTTWETGINAPLLNASLSLRNLVSDSILTSNPDNSVSLKYDFNFDVLNGGSIFKIPNDTLVDTSLNTFPNPIPFSPGQQLPEIKGIIKMDYADSRITEMKVKSGIIKYTLTSQVNENLIYRLKIPGSRDQNGMPFEQTIIVPGGTQANPGSVESEFDLSNIVFDMTGENNNNHNRIFSTINVEVDPNGSTVFIGAEDSIFTKSVIIDITPEYVKGYIGQGSFSEPDEKIDFDAFNDLVAGSIDLNTIDLGLHLKNYTGTDLQVKLTDLTASKEGNSVTVNHSCINQLLNFSRASISSDGTITPTEHSFLLNANNSNIDEFIELLADSLFYGFDANLNPFGDISGGNDFIYLDETFKIGLDLNIPLSLITNDLTLIDTLKYTANNTTIEEGVFKLVVENKFPLNAKIQFYIINNQNAIIDSVFDNDFIYAATLNANGRAEKARKTTLVSNLTAEKMTLLNNSTKIVAKAVFNTTGIDHVTIFDDYFIDLTLVGDFNFTAEFK